MMLVNNPGDWSHVYAQLLHAKWHGWTFTDFIFPFFLFIGGVSMTLSLGRLAHAGADKRALFVKLAKRAGIIFLIGFVLNLYPRFDFATVRVMGVLQRIALCVICSAPVVIWGGIRAQVLTILWLFAVYSGLMLFVPVPDATGVVAAGILEPGRDVGAYLDRLVLDGHLWAAAKTWDPEGLLSTLPAIGSQLFGVLAGHWIASQRTHLHKALGMVLGGGVCILVGIWLGEVFMPVNKSLWTPSYAVLMTGWALVIFGGFFFALDVYPSRVAEITFKPFVIFGMNALFLFAFSAFVVKTMMWIKFTGADGAVVSLRTLLWQGFAVLPLAPVNASLLYAVAFTLAMFAVAWFMWRKRWFVKV
jgi:predicted acyltransferase